uniref:Uncharacterized protein n=1 Tax=Amorphochlora amoebiformis TaxID=1561963 RepID=A0A0H5BHP1_9EUKA|nr:hypothetical protein [Amorphochlora amoebiformis]
MNIENSEKLLSFLIPKNSIGNIVIEQIKFYSVNNVLLDIFIIRMVFFIINNLIFINIKFNPNNLHRYFNYYYRELLKIYTKSCSFLVEEINFKKKLEKNMKT